MALLSGGFRLDLAEVQVGLTTRLVQQLTHVAFDVAHAQQFKEGLGNRQVHKSIVLDALSKKDAQKEEKLSQAFQLIAILGEGGREKATGALYIVAWRLQSPSQVHL